MIGIETPDNASKGKLVNTSKNLNKTGCGRNDLFIKNPQHTKRRAVLVSKTNEIIS